MARWTEEELDFVVENYPSKGSVWCAEHINRTAGAIKAKASSLKVKSNKSIKVTEEDILNSIKKFVEVHSRPPTAADCVSNHPILFHTSRYSRAGGLTKLLESLSLEQNKANNFSKVLTNDELVATLHRFFSEYGRAPKTHECTASHLYLVARGTYINRFGSWQSALDIAGIAKNTGRVTKQEVILKVQDFYVKNSRAPMKSDFKTSNGLFNYSTVLRLGLGVDTLLQEAGITRTPIPKVYSDEELITSLRRFFIEYGRNARQCEMRIPNEYLYSADTYYQRFGGLRAAHEAAGVPFTSEVESLPEIELKEFINSLGKFKIVSSAPVLDTGVGTRNQHIDILLPEQSLGIEYHGLHWHSEEKKPNKNYHLNKLTMATTQGIRLIQVFSSEWQNKRSIVESRLSNMLGSSTVLYARKCEIRELDPKTFREFNELNHLQGTVNSSVKLGLFHEDKLVACMGFAKSRYAATEWELTRYSNVLFTSVVGGAGKLFKYFLRNFQPKSIVSYSDLRWNTGDLYTKIGFKYSHTSAPNYHYFKSDGVLESRVKYQAHKLKELLPTYDPNLSEPANMAKAGYSRIFDCGNKVFVWDKY